MPERPVLNTVSVPQPFEPIFLKAQEYVRRYFADRVERPDLSTIAISGERYVLVRAASMSVEFFDLVMSLYRDEGTENARAVAANLLFDLAHAIGRADAKAFGQKMGVSDPVEKLSAGPVHFAFAGWAFVKIFPESSPTPDENYFLVYDHPFSFESDAWIRRGRKSDAPVCVMNAGYSSGWCEESFGLPLVAAEIECVAAGGAQCRFVMAPPSRIEEHLKRLTGAGAETRTGAHTRIRVPEFFQRKRMEDELRRQQESLERRVEARTAELLQTNELLRSEIGERRRSEQQLRLLESAVQSADEGIVVMSPGTLGSAPRILFVNHGFSRMTGIPHERAVGATLGLIEVEDAGQRLEQALHASLAEGRAYRGEVIAVRSGGTRWALELHVTPIKGVAGEVTHWIGILRDVSERKAQLAALEHQALHDVLTDLPNRVLLQDRLEQALFTANRTHTSLALLFMDLDRFKDVNDTFGHHYGDQLLRQVGTRLREELRASDSISRLGGDEFALLLPLLDGAPAAILTARKVLRALEQPFVIEGQSVDVGASVGIALFPDHGTDATTLMKRADVAMYVAKHAGTGYAIYRADQDPHSADRLALVGELKAGLEQAQLLIQLQPIVSLGLRSVVRLEALVRWQHPQHGLLPPDRFIGVAERSGVINGLTDRVLELACRECRTWREAGKSPGVSVNVSARNLQDAGFPEKILKILHENDLPPSALTLEITESGVVADPSHTLKVLTRLRASGLSIAIDDFGTGYSSLTHLKQLPVDEIKIDRSFVLDMPQSAGDAAIVRSMVDLARNFRCRAVAEGVEDEATFRRLGELGCDLVQGYFVSRPLDVKDLADWFRLSPWNATSP